MTTRQFVRRMRERCRKRENRSTGPYLHVVTWAIVTLVSVPTIHRGGEQRNQMTSVFDAGQKVMSGAMQSGILPGGTRVQAVQQPMQLGGAAGTGVFFHIARGCIFHTDRKHKKHNSLKLSIIFHRMILTMCVLYPSSNIKNNQAMIITLKAD